MQQSPKSPRPFDKLRPYQPKGPAPKAERPTKHIAVRDEDATFDLSNGADKPFVIPKDYIAKKSAHLPPKQPLGRRPSPAPKKGALFYSAAATFGSAQRVRRARPEASGPVVAVVSQGRRIPDAVMDNIKEAGAAAGAALLAVGIGVRQWWGSVFYAFHRLPVGHGRLIYSAATGAIYRKLGVRREWWRLGLPLLLAIFIVGLLLFNYVVGGHFYDTGQQPSSGSTTADTQSTSNGSNTAPVSSRSKNPPKDAKATAPSNGSTTVPQPRSGSYGRSSGSGSGYTGGSSTGGLVGGYGGGSGLSGTSVTPVPVSSTTSGGSIPTPTTSGGSGGGTGSTSSTGGTSSGSSGSIPPSTSSTLPLTVTVPPVGSSLDGKNVVSSSGPSLTLN